MSKQIITEETLKGVALRLLDYCRNNDWAGYDPYDALNSRILEQTPLVRSRFFRIAVTQLLKRLPFNIRPLLQIQKEQNPKGLALFLMAFVKLEKLSLLPDENHITRMIERLIDLRSREGSVDRKDPMNQTKRYWCWGYSFPWQTRSIIVPKAYPNLVCTTFVANALLDLYGFMQSDSSASGRMRDIPPSLGKTVFNASAILDMAVSAAEYVLNELYWSDGDACGFSYPLPGLDNRVHNANFLGSALLARAYKLTAEKKFLESALRAARYSAEQQNIDGSWSYGEHSTQAWIDNFHTGYNLCALKVIDESAGTAEFEPCIRRGFQFYLENFFGDGFIPKYFHNRTYPIDIHSVAQSIITLLTFVDLDASCFDRARAVLDYAIEYLWNDDGYFGYQLFPWVKNRIPYMRWSEAWMLFSLSALLEAMSKARTQNHTECSEQVANGFNV